MKRRALPVWCQIECVRCGCFVGCTYWTPKTISKLRRDAKEIGLVYDKELHGCICPKCREERKLYNESN